MVVLLELGADVVARLGLGADVVARLGLGAGRCGASRSWGLPPSGVRCVPLVVRGFPSSPALL